MSRGHWCIVVAALGCLANAPQSGAKADQQQAQANQAESSPPATASAQLVAPIQPPEYYRPCRQDRQDYDSDLCAQWTAAKNAGDAAYWAKWGFWAGLFGLGGLLLNLVYTQRALNHARRVARADLRPWITYRGFNLNPFTDGLIDGEKVARGILGSVTLQNIGKSPALNVRVFSKHEVVPPGAAPPKFESTGSQPHPVTLAPGYPVNGAPLGVGPDTADAIMERRVSLWLYAKVAYEEPGHEGPPYETEVEVRIEYAGEEVLPDGSRRHSFSSIPEGPQNRLT